MSGPIQRAVLVFSRLPSQQDPVSPSLFPLSAQGLSGYLTFTGNVKGEIENHYESDSAFYFEILPFSFKESLEKIQGMLQTAQTLECTKKQPKHKREGEKIYI